MRGLAPGFYLRCPPVGAAPRIRINRKQDRTIQKPANDTHRDVAETLKKRVVTMAASAEA